MKVASSPATQSEAESIHSRDTSPKADHEENRVSMTLTEMADLIISDAGLSDSENEQPTSPAPLPLLPQTPPPPTTGKPTEGTSPRKKYSVRLVNPPSTPPPLPPPPPPLRPQGRPRSTDGTLPTCVKCKSEVVSECIEMSPERLYHVHCFVCTLCGKYAGTQFYNIGGEAYCDMCAKQGYIAQRTTPGSNECERRKYAQEFEQLRERDGDLLIAAADADAGGQPGSWCRRSIMNPQSLPTDNPEGFLLLLLPWNCQFCSGSDNNGSVKVWKRKWFTLQDRQLMWYDNIQQKFTSGRDSPPEGFIDLAFAKFESVPAATDEEEASGMTAAAQESVLAAHRDSAFVLGTDCEQYMFLADSTEEMKVWVEEVESKRKEVAQEREEIKTTSDKLKKHFSTFEKMEGELKLLQHGKFTWWKTVWVSITGGILSVYRTSRTKKEIIGQYTLYECEMEEYREPEGTNPNNSTTNTSKPLYALKLSVRPEERSEKSTVLVLRAETQTEFFSWVNAITKHKVLIEDKINSITVNTKL